MGGGYNGWGKSNHWRWHLKFAWLPVKLDCGKFIWWKEYYHGVGFKLVPAGEDLVILHQYMTPQEYLINVLKNA